MLHIHIYGAEMHMYEAGLTMPYNPVETGDLTRQQILYACLVATKNVFEVQFIFPLTECYDLPLTLWAMLSYSIVVLSKLLFFEGSDWDLESARKVCDLSTVLERLAVRCLEMKDEVRNVTKRKGLPEVDDAFFDSCVMKLRWMKAWYERRVQDGGTGSDDEPIPPNVLSARPWEDGQGDINGRVDELMAGGMFDFWDEMGWQESWGGWDPNLYNPVPQMI